MKTGIWIVIGALLLGVMSYTAFYYFGKKLPRNTQVLRNSLRNKAMAELGTNILFFNTTDINHDHFPDLLAVQLLPNTIKNAPPIQNQPLQTDIPFECRRLIMIQIENKRYRKYLDIQPEGLFTLELGKKYQNIQLSKSVPILQSTYAKWGYQATILKNGNVQLFQIDSLGKPITEQIILQWNPDKKQYGLAI